MHTNVPGIDIVSLVLPTNNEKTFRDLGSEFVVKWECLCWLVSAKYNFYVMRERLIAELISDWSYYIYIYLFSFSASVVMYGCKF